MLSKTVGKGEIKYVEGWEIRRYTGDNFSTIQPVIKRCSSDKS